MSVSSSSHKLNILHLDDNPDYLELVEEFFTRFNISNPMNLQVRLKSRESHQAAINDLKFQRFDILITDCIMTKNVTCFTVLKQLESLGVSIPIILLTGQSKYDLQKKAKGVNSDFFYLEKSFGVLKKLPKLITAMAHTNYNAGHYCS